MRRLNVVLLALVTPPSPTTQSLGGTNRIRSSGAVVSQFAGGATSRPAAAMVVQAVPFQYSTMRTGDPALFVLVAMESAPKGCVAPNMQPEFAAFASSMAKSLAPASCASVVSTVTAAWIFAPCPAHHVVSFSSPTTAQSMAVGVERMVPLMSTGERLDTSSPAVPGTVFAAVFGVPSHLLRQVLTYGGADMPPPKGEPMPPGSPGSPSKRREGEPARIRTRGHGVRIRHR